MTRYLFYSNSPWTATGYGKQTRLLGTALVEDGHEVGVLCNYGLGGVKSNFLGMQLFPQGSDVWSEDVIDPVVSRFDPDWVVSLCDLWVLKPGFWFDIRDRLIPWVPVDHQPTPLGVQRFIETVAPRRLLAMSEFGKVQLNRLDGYKKKDRVSMVPHTFDETIYHPGGREEAKKLFSIPEDRTVFGMVAMNKGTYKIRKSFPQIMLAFDLYVRTVDPDALLFLHTDIGQPRVPGEHKVGVNLARLGHLIGVPDRNVLVADQFSVKLGIEETNLADLYRAMDVLLLPSMGEGFGVPVLEAMACGTPAIVSDFTAQPELVKKGGGLTVSGLPDWDEGQCAWLHLPDPKDICAKMVEMVEDPTRYKGFQENAIASADFYRSKGFLHRFWYPAFRDIPPVSNPKTDMTEDEAPLKIQDPDRYSQEEERRHVKTYQVHDERAGPG